MSTRKRKSSKKRKKGRHLVSTKPSIWYYLLMIFFPIIFFLVDDSSDIFERQWSLDWETILSVMFLFLCFGIPMILFLSRREIKLFEDRLILRWPSFNMTKEYSLENLIRWEYLDFYVQNAGRQKYLYIWFDNSRKISIHGIQSNKFRRLVDFFEKTHSDKKRQRKSLGDRIANWIRNKKTGPNSSHKI